MNNIEKYHTENIRLLKREKLLLKEKIKHIESFIVLNEEIIKNS